MKNFINIGIALLLLSLIVSCSKDDNSSFLKRDTDKLSFAYRESKATFTVRTNGQWSIDLSEADWASVDQEQGVNDGENVQVVTVTASRNIGAARAGIVKIIGGGKEALINIQQEEGTVLFGTPSFTEPLLPSTELEEAFLVIPYEKGGITGSVQVSCQVNGVGAGSIQVPNVNVSMEAESGAIRIPIQGTPAVEGAVVFVVQVLGQNITVNTLVKEQGNLDPVGTVYLSQNFGLLVLGGDHVADAKGIRLKETSTPWAKLEGKNVLPANPEYEATPSGNTDGTGDYFNTMHSSYVAMRGLAGWSGLRVYERPGYVKLGTTPDPGYLNTPPLANIQGWADIKVKFSAARWSENTTADVDAKVIVSILNAGTSDAADMEIALTPQWEDKEIIVEGATAATVIQFKTRTVANSRILLDNIEISKVIK